MYIRICTYIYIYYAYIHIICIFIYEHVQEQSSKRASSKRANCKRMKSKKANSKTLHKTFRARRVPRLIVMERKTRRKEVGEGSSVTQFSSPCQEV